MKKILIALCLVFLLAGQVFAEPRIEYVTPPANEQVKGDGTAGRVMRVIYLSIENATDAAKIICTTGSRWNGDANGAVDNVAKGATTGVWTLSASGATLLLLNTGISGDAVAVISAEIYSNASRTALTVAGSVNGGIQLSFYNATSGAAVDLTTLVDTGAIYLNISYLTSA